ncbi:MAG TPA: hypothetical protein ENH56_15745 [Roseobacter sp.]|uniref:Acetolactate synthase n=1 Tax=marine sediment metagenome TaxID=412755 RepID=A0A0F9U1L0_9ZZZZ|nr:hypothetical protein [Roseobacter sp.]
MKLALAFILAATTAQAVDVPSGQPVELQEVLVDQVSGETWLRFRFIAPQIARNTGAIDSVQAGPDMAFLCEAVAAPYIAQYELTGDVIVISMSDRRAEFGAADPDMTQFFELFRLNNNTCIWEGL